MKKFYQKFLPFLVFLFVAVIASCFYLKTKMDSIEQERGRYESLEMNESNLIRDCFDTVIARAYTLKALVIADKGKTDSFSSAASAIYKDTKDSSGVKLKNLALAPDGVVSAVYPLAGNNSLIGFDFMDETKKGNEEAVQAYKLDKLVATNPFELVQGGIGMGCRLPIFLNENDPDSFWGLVTVTIDFEAFMDAIDITSLHRLGAHYELWYETSDGEKKILSASDQAPENPVTFSFPLQNLTWKISASPKSGWSNPLEDIIFITGILAIATLSALQTRDHQRIRMANLQLERLAHLDALTSCYSRQYVNTVLINQVNGQWNDPSAHYSLAMIDIDYFKSVNDTYGHEMGDRAIVSVARLLQDSIKAENGDLVIRHGGDEFIVLYNNVTLERLKKKLDSIVSGVRTVSFSDQPELHLTVSIGAKFYTSPNCSLYFDMVNLADKMLYKAKEEGRNQYVLDSEDQNEA